VACFFFIVVHGGVTPKQRLRILLPSFVITALVLGKLFASWNILLYVQRKATDVARFTMHYDLDVAVANALFTCIITRQVFMAVMFHASYEAMQAEHQFRGRDIDDAIMDRARRGEFGALARDEASQEEADREHRANGPVLSFILAAHAWRGFGSAILAILAWTSLIMNATLHSHLGNSEMWDGAFQTDLFFSTFWAILATSLWVCINVGLKYKMIDHPSRTLPTLPKMMRAFVGVPVRRAV